MIPSPGHQLRVLSPEGLIVTKLFSFRPQDQEDIRVLLAANQNTIDLDSIRREWAAVSLGEEARSAWLEAEIVTSQRCRRAAIKKNSALEFPPRAGQRGWNSFGSRRGAV